MKTHNIRSVVRSSSESSAFTLVEIMIVVAIIGLIASIGIPYFVTYRASAQNKTCVANLRQIEAAKEQWALEEKKNSGEACNMSDLVGTDKYLKNSVVCPAAGGAGYNVNVVGTDPTCPSSIPEHVLPQ